MNRPGSSAMQNRQAITILAALAQESRLAVYRLLIEHAPEGLAASAIAEKLGLPNATLSFHLKELSHAGLVSSRRSEEHTSELQSRRDLVCRLLLEKKKQRTRDAMHGDP